jgi:hypothetical protein
VFTIDGRTAFLAEEQSKTGHVWPGIGMEFDRHATWWPMGSTWLTYLARCQQWRIIITRDNQ